MKIIVLLLLASWALVAYTYLLFPLLVAALSRTVGRDQDGDEWADADLPTVTVVVAAYNEARFIEAKVRNTWQIDYPADRLTLLIGSDGSSDATPELLRASACPRLQSHIFTQRRGKVSVLNDLMTLVNTDLVILSDGNTMLAPDSVRKLARHFRDPQVGCVNGALAIEHNGGVSGEGIYWRYELWLKRLESRLGFVIGCYGGILAVRSELYRPMPATTIVEDFVLTMSIMARGGIVRFDPDARATEPASASSHDEWERKVRIGAGDFQALALTRDVLHPRFGLRAWAFWSHKVLRWFVPFFLLLAFAANLGIVCLVPYFGPWAGLLGLQVAAGVLAAVVFRLPAGARVPSIVRPVSYFILMNYALLCGFVRWVRGRQPVTWRQAVRQASGESS